MQRVPVWKIVFIVFVLLFSFWYLMPTIEYYSIDAVERQKDEYQDTADSALKLGLDLQGGVHLVIEVDLEKYEQILKDQGKTENEIDYAMDMVLDQAAAVIQSRVDQYGVAEASIIRQPPNRLVLEMPGMSNAEQVRELVQAEAQLSFHLMPTEKEFGLLLGEVVEEVDEVDFQSLLAPQRTGMAMVYVPMDNVNKVDDIINSEAITHLIPREYLFKWGPEEEQDERYSKPHRKLYLIEERPQLTGALLDTAWVDYGMTNQPIIYLKFNSTGKSRFAQVSGDHVKEPLAIMLEDTIFSAPTIQDRITTGSATITGINNIQEAQQIAVVLRAGALPAPLVVQESRVVGPSMGTDSIQKGIYSVIVGGVLVLIFMVVYYTLTGVVADIAVILNLIFLMAGMALFNATLTLPGIAGIILTIGMAVDANVLIFERLREEMKTKRSQSLPLILDKGYGRAFMTIFDANLTTLITAVILFQFGTGPIKGFAITLSLGILVSMFTAVFVSRVIQDVLYAWGMQTLHLGFIKFFANANFDFFKKTKLAMSVTGLVGVVGFVVLVMGWQSGELKGIDFSGGAEIYAKFDDTIEVQNVRDSLENAGLKNAVIQSVLDQENEVLIRVGEGVVTQPDELTTIVENAMPGKSFETIGSNIVGAKVGGELLWKALNCLIFSSIGILLYITARFEFRFAVASVITLFHDLLFTLAILAFVGTEFNLPTIAALLTVLGYSLNDTIVIFDRIRENYRSAVLDFRQMVNLSINQTLSRTTNTSLTTFLVVLVLYLFAGSVIHDFALTLMIGVVIGTYSSIFVASPILFLMTQGGKKGIKERKKAMIEEAES